MKAAAYVSQYGISFRPDDLTSMDAGTPECQGLSVALVQPV